MKKLGFENGSVVHARSRAKGAEWERHVKQFLETKGWVVTRWSNKVIDGELRTAPTSRFNTKTGWPDFVAYGKNPDRGGPRFVTGIECKYARYLRPEEKRMASWLRANHIMDAVLVASKPKKNDDPEFKNEGVTFTNA